MPPGGGGRALDPELAVSGIPGRRSCSERAACSTSRRGRRHSPKGRRCSGRAARRSLWRRSCRCLWRGLAPAAGGQRGDPPLGGGSLGGGPLGGGPLGGRSAAARPSLSNRYGLRNKAVADSGCKSLASSSLPPSSSRAAHSCCAEGCGGGHYRVGSVGSVDRYLCGCDAEGYGGGGCREGRLSCSICCCDARAHERHG